MCAECVSFIVVNWMSVTLTSLATLINSLYHWSTISSHWQHSRILLPRSSIFRSSLLSIDRFRYVVSRITLHSEISSTFSSFSIESVHISSFITNRLISFSFSWLLFSIGISEESAEIVLCVQLVIFENDPSISTLVSEVQQICWLSSFVWNGTLHHLEAVVLK